MSIFAELKSKLWLNWEMCSNNGSFKSPILMHILSDYTPLFTSIYIYIYIYIWVCIYVFVCVYAYVWLCECATICQPIRTYLQQLCSDTGCSLEDLPKVMNDRDEWWESERERERERESRKSVLVAWFYDDIIIIIKLNWQHRVP